MRAARTAANLSGTVHEVQRIRGLVVKQLSRIERFQFSFVFHRHSHLGVALDQAIRRQLLLFSQSWEPKFPPTG